MKRSLLIVGAGMYALLSYEIARSMAQFDKIDFVDDQKKQAPTGDAVVGNTSDLKALSNKYSDVIVAIGNPDVRLYLLDRIKQEKQYHIATLISPQSYISPSASIDEGTIVEPFAVIHTQCTVKRGCLISAGAVVNHGSVCEEGVHIDCNATVPGYAVISAKTKIASGMVYEG